MVQRETPTAEYKGSKDKAIKKAIAKEEFIGEVAETDNPDANVKKVDVMKLKRLSYIIGSGNLFNCSNHLLLSFRPW